LPRSELHPVAAHKDEGLYFRADAGCQYAATYTIDLADVAPQVALYPSPDNCKPVTELADMRVDGAFIGACTTTQEDLILGALILEAMMKAGHAPLPAPKGAHMRRVTPGSLAIIEYLKSHGLIEVYEKAGFVVGVPGCSYCLGIAADVAGEGEVWLSSQNRNFKNRCVLVAAGAAGGSAPGATRMRSARATASTRARLNFASSRVLRLTSFPPVHTTTPPSPAPTAAWARAPSPTWRPRRWWRRRRSR
jgi:homoaconitate hydratase